MLSESNFGASQESGLDKSAGEIQDRTPSAAEEVAEQRADLHPGAEIYFREADGKWAKGMYIGVGAEGFVYVKKDGEANAEPLAMNLEKFNRENTTHLKEIADRANMVNELLADREERYQRGEKGDSDRYTG